MASFAFQLQVISDHVEVAQDQDRAGEAVMKWFRFCANVCIHQPNGRKEAKARLIVAELSQKNMILGFV